MRKRVWISTIIILCGSLLAACPSSSPTSPTLMSFTINNGDTTTSNRAVLLNNTCTGSPTEYMASESATFIGASWQSYATAPTFTLSSGEGVKTVYFKVKNSMGESTSISDSITLSGGSSGTEETVLLPGNVPLELVWCPAGSFLMGAAVNEEGSWTGEIPQHQVTLSHGFWIGKYEITKRQWAAVMNTSPWAGEDYVLNDLDSPAVFISWDDAQLFISALSGRTGKTFRLPTEAEWEYACRAGTSSRFYWGEDADLTLIGDYAWYYYNADVVEGQRFAHVVGQKKPNAFGLYDMSGNVWEMVQDWWENYPSAAPVTDPTGPTTSEFFRVSRGGCWTTVGNDFCRSAFRTGFSPDFSYFDLGFRIAR